MLEKYFAKGVQNGEGSRAYTTRFTRWHFGRPRSLRRLPRDKVPSEHYCSCMENGKTISRNGWLRAAFNGLRLLTVEHWARIQHVNTSMMLYIALTSHATLGAAKPAGVLKLEESNRGQDPHLGILTQQDIDNILWNNLERIDAVFGTAIQEAACLPEYDWTAGQIVDELQSLPHMDLKRRVYLAARRAGRQDCERLVRHRALADHGTGMLARVLSTSHCSLGLGRRFDCGVSGCFR